MLVSPVEHASRVLTPAATSFIEDLTRQFRPRIEELLARRRAGQQRLDAGQRLDFLPDTAAIRRGEWRVAPIPDDLEDRRVEITGPVAPASGELGEFLTLPGYDILVKKS